MDFYANHYLDWKPSKDGSRLFWQTLDEATYGIKYANVARLLKDYATPEQKQLWKEKLFYPTAELLNSKYLIIHNIATWHRAAVAQIALLYGDEAMWKEALNGKFGLRQQIAEGVTGDYIWYEQSLGYNNFLLNALEMLFTTAGLSGRADELGTEMAVTENMMFSPMAIRFPDGYLPNPADSLGRPKASKAMTEAMYRVFPTAMGMKELQGKYNWNTLLDPPAAPREGVTDLPEVVSRSLESTRMAVLKSGSWQVFFHYGQLTRSHSQAEALNFGASFDGVDITHDTGTVGYGSPMHKGYYSTGLNHNVLLVNGEGEVPPQKGELIAFSANPAKVTAAQPDYRPDAKAERRLEIRGDTLIDTATIELKGSEPQKLGLVLQLQGDPVLPKDFQPDPKFAEGRPESFSYWHDVTTATCHGRFEFDVACKGLTLHITIATPGEFRVWEASTPDAPPQRRAGLYVEKSGTKATFTTIFKPKG